MGGEYNNTTNSNLVLSAPSASGAKTQHPATFVTKLYLMVDDPSTNAYIRWGSDGTTFIVFFPEEFARDILPRFFKHNNFSSFIRQLNMYGFHKVPHFTSSPHPLYESTSTPNSTVDIFSRPLSLSSAGYPHTAAPPSYSNSWEFSHEYFRRNQMHLLMNVRRKNQHPGQPSSVSSTTTTSNPVQIPSSCEFLPSSLYTNHINGTNNSNAVLANLVSILSNPDLSHRLLEYISYIPGGTTASGTSPLAIGANSISDGLALEDKVDDVHSILNELLIIKSQQKLILEKLTRLEMDQSLLWRDSLKYREKSGAQQELIEKILRFLASVFTSGDKKLKDGLAGLFHFLNLQQQISSTSSSQTNSSANVKNLEENEVNHYNSSNPSSFDHQKRQKLLTGILQEPAFSNRPGTPSTDLTSGLDSLELENPLGPDFDLASFLNSEITYNDETWNNFNEPDQSKPSK